MPRPARLLACPTCACHVKATEARCPHCDAPIRRADGSVQRTAAAILLGLSTSVAACGDRDIPVYGTPATGGAGGTMTGTAGTGGGGTAGAGAGGTAGASMGGAAGAGMGGSGGASMGGGGAGGTAGAGGDTNIPVYGAAPSTGGAGGAPQR